MRAVDVIIKKRDKKELTREEIRFFVHGISNWTYPRLPGLRLGDGRPAQWHDPP